MNNKIANTIIFTLGSAIGSVSTWLLVKDKYARKADEEIESVIAAFQAKEDISKLKPKEEPSKADALNEYKELIWSNKSYRHHLDLNEKKVEEKVDKPYVIPPDEFGEFDEYDKISLNYYADGVLTDDINEIIDDVDDIVGVESLSTFGEYEDDSVFVRNDRLKADYEILYDSRKFKETKNKRLKPHQMED